MTVMSLASSVQAGASIETDAFRRVMAELAAGVAVVTTLGADGEPRGLTTTALTSVSLDPPLVLVCIGSESRTLPAIRASGHFVVNLVHAAASELAARFASKAEDKFAGSSWRPGLRGSPVLHDDVHAWLECRVEREIEAGDHVVLLGHVEHGDASEGELEPLTYYRRRFGTWAPDSATERSAR
jgi:flavin reductase (DIM6/NTAB) family NADH-FMN oxidoreductase RutF